MVMASEQRLIERMNAQGAGNTFICDAKSDKTLNAPAHLNYCALG